MTKKLRIKFILISTISITLLLSLILLTVNITNYSRISKDADSITLILLNEGGEFNIIDDPLITPTPFDNIEDIFSERGGNRPEVRFDSRYFSVEFGENGKIESVNTAHIRTISRDEAINLAGNIYTKNGTGWYKSFRYRVGQSEDNKTIVIFLDYSRELTPSKNVLVTSIIIGGLGLILSFVAIYFISNIVVKPVDDAFNKQKHFISNSSHELKTPLTIISANNEILELKYGEDESIEAIGRQVGRLSSMVKELNQLAKIDEINKLESFNEFNLSEAITHVSIPFEELFNKDNKKLKLDVDSDIFYRGDESLIKNVISIILENAYKYSLTYSSLSLKISNAKIVIEERNDSDYLKDGPLDELFERFYRADDVRASSIEGSGIGLSILKEIVGLHKGKVKAYSENKEFVIRIEL